MGMLVAKDSFSFRYEGADHAFVAGQTRVDEGHPILVGIRHLFEPLKAHYAYEVEQATAAPGERRMWSRSQPPPEDVVGPEDQGGDPAPVKRGPGRPRKNPA